MRDVEADDVEGTCPEGVPGLSDDASVEDAMEGRYFLAKVEGGLRRADTGKTMSHEEAKRRILE